MNPSVLIALVAAPIAGSFLGAVASRAPDIGAALRGRSRCDSCGVTLGLLDLVPILSWAALRGRCRHCGAPIDPVHPAIEIACLGVAAWAATLVDGPMLGLGCWLGWLLVALAAIDIRTGLLPDALVLALGLGGLGGTLWLAPGDLWWAVLGGAIGAGILALVALTYRRLRGHEGLGWGDVKLMGAIGIWVGPEGLAGVLLAASVGGLVYAGARGLAGRPVAADEALPFGPFLAMGAWLVWLYGL